MSRQKKSRNDKALQKLLIVTAILNLLRALIDLIRDLTG